MGCLSRDELVNNILVGQTQISSALDEMYLSQPPVKEVKVEIEEPYEELFGHHLRRWYVGPVGSTTVRDEEGVSPSGKFWQRFDDHLVVGSMSTSSISSFDAACRSPWRERGHRGSRRDYGEERSRSPGS